MSICTCGYIYYGAASMEEGCSQCYPEAQEPTVEAYSVEFNANGGSCSVGSKGVYNEEEYGTLPTPTREGYSFDGWYTAATGGSRITATTTVTKTVDHFVYAHWTQSESGESKIVMTLGSPNISVNGQSTQIDAQGTVPVIRNDRTLLPVCAVIEVMGGDVTWSAANRTATLKRNGKTLFLQINNAVAWDAEGATYTLDAAPVIINDRTLLPLRMIAEYFGAKVSWDSDTRSATISYTK